MPNRRAAIFYARMPGDVARPASVRYDRVPGRALSGRVPGGRVRRCGRGRRHRALGAFALSALLFLASCSTTVGGSAVLGTTAARGGSGGAPLPLGPITEPTSAPRGSAASGSAGTGQAPDTTSAPTSGTRPTTSPTTTPTTSGPTARTDPALAKFYSQRLSWGACAGFAASADVAPAYASPAFQCARLTVPLSYASPGGQTVTTGVLRKVATDPSARIGSLVIDPGGPGGSGMGYVAQIVLLGAPTSSASRTVSQLNARFDLVGIDPRGVGSAVPAVQCQTDAQRDAARAQDTRSRDQADVNAAKAMAVSRAADCVANTGRNAGVDGRTFLADIGTRDVARDLDVLRAVLGDEKLTYLGFSYGTKIGYEYAEQFPTRVRAIEFDGDENPQQDPATLLLNEYKQFQAAFDEYARWCASTLPSCPLGTDPATAVPTYQGIVRPLLDKPVPVGDGRTLSFGDAITGTTFALYFNELRPALAVALAHLKAGQGDAMMALADEYDGRDAQGHYSNELEVLDAVDCVDGPRITDPAKITALQQALNAAAPYMATGDPAGALVDACTVWPVPPTLLPHKLKIAGLPKTLVISTTGDPATPYADGVELAKEIGATLLTVKAVRHTSYLHDDECVNAIGTAYLLTLAFPVAGTTCD